MSMHFRNIALICNINANPASLLTQIYQFLRKQDYHLFPETRCQTLLAAEDTKFYQFAELQHCDLAIVIGGDGTLLNAARQLAHYNIPLLGINLGRLGFLVDVSPKTLLESLENVLAGHYIAEQRALLQTKVLRDNAVITEQLASNDVVVKNVTENRMIQFATYINQQYVNHERADGLIIATPTGSTAYALSAGGPILHPTLSALALVPICPHTLNHRPIVVAADSHIMIKIDPDCQTTAQVSFDGQANLELLPNDCIITQQALDKAILLHPEGYDFFSILRAKLNWGKSPSQTANNE